MNITTKACEISFELDHPIEVRREGGLQDVSMITFQQPTRKTAPLFQNLAGMFTRALTQYIDSVSAVDEETINEAREELNQEMIEEGNKSLSGEAPNEIKEETIENEVENLLMIMTSLDFDFEKGFKLFDRIILSGGTRSKACSVGGVPLTDTILDRVNYRDYYKMLAVYLTFFGKPAKSDSQNDSSRQQDCAMPVTEV